MMTLITICDVPIHLTCIRTKTANSKLSTTLITNDTGLIPNRTMHQAMKGSQTMLTTREMRATGHTSMISIKLCTMFRTVTITITTVSSRNDRRSDPR